MNENPQEQESSSVKFVYLESNKQKVSQLVSSYKRQSVFALTFSIFFALYQLQSHLAIYFRSYFDPEVLSKSPQLEYHSMNLHSFYAFMTLKVALAMVYKAWKIKRQPGFGHYEIETFRRQSTQVEDYIYLNLLIVCLTLVRLFESGILLIWFDFVGSTVGILLGKLLEKERSEIIHYSTQLRQQSID